MFSSTQMNLTLTMRSSPEKCHENRFVLPTAHKLPDLFLIELMVLPDEYDDPVGVEGRGQQAMFLQVGYAFTGLLVEQFRAHVVDLPCANRA